MSGVIWCVILAIWEEAMFINALILLVCHGVFQCERVLSIQGKHNVYVEKKWKPLFVFRHHTHTLFLSISRCKARWCGVRCPRATVSRLDVLRSTPRKNITCLKTAFVNSCISLTRS